MQITWTTAADANRKFAGQMCFGAGSEGTRFLMPHMHPVNDTKATKCIAEAIERIAGHAIDTFDASFDQGLHHQIGHGSAHFNFSTFLRL
jgi:hypothetical protein